MPRVSVIIPSYNHSRYIKECIQSVLDQTYQDFEIIITDDGSTDDSVQRIKEFNDPRINLQTFTGNRGACVAINHCLSKSSGEYIAILNSDDAWEPGKLKKQVAFLDSHPDIGAVFTRVTFINENGNPLHESDYKFFHVFDHENRSRFEWLNHFFYLGNCLCHPSILIRKDCYNKIGLYEERMANLPDLDLWVRLCMTYSIHIIDEKMVRFRIMGDKSNASADRMSTHIRSRFEYIQILDHYLAINDSDFFLKVFPDAGKYGEIENQYIPYFLSRIALQSSNGACHPWGMRTLFDFMGKEGVERALAVKYGFKYTDFHRFAAEYDVYNITPIFNYALPLKDQIALLKTGNQSRLMRFAISVHSIIVKLALKVIK